MKKIIDRAPSVSLHITDREKAAGRLLVSSLTVLDSSEARARGYRPFGAILPTQPREPTPRELDKMIDTRAGRTLQLIELPARFGSIALSAPLQEDRASLPLWNQWKPIIQDINGVFIERRADEANSLTTSVDVRYHSGISQGFARTGMHVDRWPSPDVTYLVANLGNMTANETTLVSGEERWHLVSPWIDRQTLNVEDGRLMNINIIERVRGMLRNGTIGPEDPMVWWVKQESPHPNGTGSQVIEAVVGNHVANNLHDGSSWAAYNNSTAVMASVEPILLGTFPSVL